MQDKERVIRMVLTAEKGEWQILCKELESICENRKEDLEVLVVKQFLGLVKQYLNID